MKLWLLERTNDHSQEWDIPLGYVVRAYSADEARAIAKAYNNDYETWSCTEIVADGESGILLESFKAG